MILMKWIAKGLGTRLCRNCMDLQPSLTRRFRPYFVYVNDYCLRVVVVSCHVGEIIKLFNTSSRTYMLQTRKTTDSGRLLNPTSTRPQVQDKNIQERTV